ncbi:MAG: diaminopimelate epimerase, partial [Planctomycetota bacterium]
DRHTGIGADGLILIGRPEPGPDLPAGPGVRMRMFNTDGTESPMCGNGIRCVAKYAVDHGLVELDGDGGLWVQTGAGVVRTACRGGPRGIEAVTVDMGEPILDLAGVPVERQRLDGGDGPTYSVSVDGTPREAVFVSMGNPHAVFFVDDVEQVDLARLGPRLEHHEAFPQGMNVHFVQVAGPDEVTVRTWERGSGITGACGSGACAVCVAGVLTGRSGGRLLAHLPGGDLELAWDGGGGRVRMTGPAVEVFTGAWDA